MVSTRARGPWLGRREPILAAAGDPGAADAEGAGVGVGSGGTRRHSYHVTPECRLLQGHLLVLPLTSLCCCRDRIVLGL